MSEQILQIPVGNPVKFTVNFLDENNVAFDPVSGIELVIKDPHGNMTTYAYPSDIIRVGTGIYSKTVAGTIAGYWVAFGQGLLSDGTPVTTDDLAVHFNKTSVVQA